MAKGTEEDHQKAEMKIVQNDEQSEASFEQHRLEIFKMANELSILTGAQVALMVSSPDNKVFSFGCPDVKFVIDKYKNQIAGRPLARGRRAPEKSTRERLARKLAIVEEKVENEKKRGKMLDKMLEERKGKKKWWEAPIENLELNQLKELSMANQALYDDLSKVLGKMPASHLINDQAPTSMDGSQNVTIPYLVKKFSSLAAGEGNSITMPPEMSGSDGVLQCEDSSRTNFCVSEMVASTSGSNSMGSFLSKGTNN